jgi:hypothetical protein
MEQNTHQKLTKQNMVAMGAEALLGLAINAFALA